MFIKRKSKATIQCILICLAVRESVGSVMSNSSTFRRVIYIFFSGWVWCDVNGKVVNIPLKSVRNDEFEVLFR